MHRLGKTQTKALARETREYRAQTEALRRLLSQKEELEEILGLRRGELQSVEAELRQFRSEVRKMSEQKAALILQLGLLADEEAKVKERLDKTMRRENMFIETAKAELQKEREVVKNVKREAREARDEESSLKKVVAEIESYVRKEARARTRWLAVQEKLGKAERRYATLTVSAKAKLRKINEEQKSLDGMKTYLTDFYGKIGSYVAFAERTLEKVNKALEGKVPTRFQIPPGDVTFNNFQKYL